MNAKHTPTPWRFVGDKSDYGRGGADVTFGYIEQDNENEFTLAVMVNDTIDGRANGDFIVRAVNCFDDMLAALRRVEASLTELGAKGEPLKTIRAAIAKAEQE